MGLKAALVAILDDGHRINARGMALAFLLVSNTTTFAQNHPLEIEAKETRKNWNVCLLQSAVENYKIINNANAAAEMAFANCETERQAIQAFLVKKMGFTRDQVEDFFLKAKSESKVEFRKLVMESWQAESSRGR